MAYLAAVYTVHEPTRAFRVVIGERHAADPPPVGRVHAMVTACNPASRMLTDTENDARMSALRESLDAQDIAWSPAVNAASDGQWREPSCWIPSIPLMTADALSLTFDQNACLIVEDDGVARLRIYRNDWRPANADEAPDDWLSWYGGLPS